MRRALVSNHILMRRGNSGCASRTMVRRAFEKRDKLVSRIIAFCIQSIYVLDEMKSGRGGRGSKNICAALKASQSPRVTLGFRCKSPDYDFLAFWVFAWENFVSSDDELDDDEIFDREGDALYVISPVSGLLHQTPQMPGHSPFAVKSSVTIF
jgi:hypothetical protein